MSTPDRYKRLSHRFTQILDAVPEDGWDAPTPCDGWSVKDVVEHVVTTELDALEQRGFGPEVQPDISNAREAWPIVRAHMESILADPANVNFGYDGYFGPTTFGETIGSFYCADLTIHGWDIARAAGLSEWEQVDQEEIDMVMSAFGPDSPFAPAMRQPGLFNAPVVAEPGADATTRLMAWLGRTS
jgi:uncharacterized protein (TIGR03086 family)